MVTYALSYIINIMSTYMYPFGGHNSDWNISNIWCSIFEYCACFRYYI